MFPTLLTLCVALTAPAADTWPGFRGSGDGLSTAKVLPLTWSPKENIAWKIDLPGYGQSSPVVWKDRVFVTAVDGEQRDKGYVLAYDAASGKQLWKHEFEPTQKAKWSATISRAAPTPAVDAAGVYAFFEGGNLLALSHEGKSLWDRSSVKDHGEFQNGHGLGASLAKTDDAVIVLIDHKGPSYLLAADKKNGKTLWKTDRDERSSWASPVVARRGGKPEIVVSSNGSVAGYEPKTGKMLWEMKGVKGNTIASAASAGEWLLVGAGKGRGGERGKEKEEPNKDELGNCCLRLVEKDGKPSYELAWKAEGAPGDYSTPLAHEGRAYFVNAVGAVACIDIKTGERCYNERTAGPCWASAIGAGERVYLFAKDGRTTVIKTGAKFEVLAKNRLWGEEKPADKDEKKSDEKQPRKDSLDPLVYGVAAVDGAFYFRTGTALYCVRVKK